MFPPITYKINQKGRVQNGKSTVWPEDFALQAHQKFITESYLLSVLLHMTPGWDWWSSVWKGWLWVQGVN